MTSSLPTPFCTEATAPLARAGADTVIARSVCIAFVATIPKSHAGECRRVGRRANVRGDLAGPREPQAVRVDRVHVRLREVVRPDLDILELCEVRREQRSHRTASHDADPHE